MFVCVKCGDMFLDKDEDDFDDEDIELLLCDYCLMEFIDPFMLDERDFLFSIDAEMLEYIMHGRN